MSPELTTEGIESLLRVATATADSVMNASWPEIEERIEQNLDLFSDEQIRRLFQIQHWQEMIQRVQPRLSPEIQDRIDALRPRSAIGRLLYSVRRKLASWGLPEGITLVEARSVIFAYRSRLAAIKHPMLHYYSEHIALMNEVVAERFPDMDEATSRKVRFYLYNQENLIGAN